MMGGNRVSLTANNSEYCCNDKMTWTTSNKYVTLVKNGVIESLRLGKAIITAISGTKTAKCTVNITGMPLIASKDQGAQYLKKYVKFVENAEGGKWSCTDKNVGTALLILRPQTAQFSLINNVRG